jgi:hypothetical protein
MWRGTLHFCWRLAIVVRRWSNGFSSLEVLRSPAQITRRRRCGLYQEVSACQLYSNVHTERVVRDGEYIPIDGEYVPNEVIVPYGNIGSLTSMLRVMVLHGGPPELLAHDLAPPFQRIMEYGARLRARLPAYLAQRRALLDGHCLLLPPLHDLVHGYERPTTDELWAWGNALDAGNPRKACSPPSAALLAFTESTSDVIFFAPPCMCSDMCNPTKRQG